MFVLLFVYVFGGAISTPGYASYKDFLIPGIIVQNIAFGGFVTAMGLAEDLNKGLIDRFRSLPMARAALLAGRTFSDVATNLMSMTILVVTGLIVGFSFHASIAEIVTGILLLVLFGYAFSWVFAFLGIAGGTNTLPGPLRWFAEVNPFTVVVDEMRELWVGTPGGSLWQSVAWSLAIIAVFAPLAVWRYRKTAER